MPFVGAAINAVAGWIVGGIASLSGGLTLGQAAFLVGAVKAVIGLAITYGLQSLLFKKPSFDPLGAAMKLDLSSTAPKRFVYGETEIAGQYVFATTTLNYEYDTSGGTYYAIGDRADLLHTVVELAGHTCESIDAFKLDGRAVPFYQDFGPTKEVAVWKDPITSQDPNGVNRWLPAPDTDYQYKVMTKLYPQGATVADHDLKVATQFLDWDSYFSLGGTFSSGVNSFISTIFASAQIRDYFKGGNGATVGIVTDYYNRVIPNVASEHYFQFDNAINTAASKTCVAIAGLFGPSGNSSNSWNSGDVLGIRVEQADGTLIVEDTSIHTVPAGGIAEGGAHFNLNAEFDVMNSTGIKVFVLLGGNKTFLTTNPRAWITLFAIVTEQVSDDSAWKDSNIGKGKCWYYARWNNSPDTFAGFPKPTVKLKGHNLVYDPRCEVSFTADHTTETFTATGHGLRDNDQIRFTTTTTLPTGLSTGTTYYVIGSTANTFQVSSTRGGAAVAITDNGTGTHTIVHIGGYRDNPALCLVNYMTTSKEEGGYGESIGGIDMAALITAANICDETVTIYDDATTQKRYRMAGTFSTKSTPEQIFAQMLGAMAGWMERINGKWVISAGAYTAPTQTITESEFRGELPQVSLNRPTKESINTVRSILRSEESNYHDAPAEEVFALNKVTVTPDHTTETFTATSHGFSDNDRVKVRSWDGTKYDDDNIPAGLLQNTWYYVINSTANTFQLSLTEGGAADTFTDNGTGTIIAFKDVYYSLDTERRIKDIEYHLVGDVTQSRRLSLITLKQARQETTASMPCKLGTPYCNLFDLKIGDSVRWIDNHKSFWERLGSIQEGILADDGTITKVSHGLVDNTPAVFNSLGDQVHISGTAFGADTARTEIFTSTSLGDARIITGSSYFYTISTVGGIAGAITLETAVSSSRFDAKSLFAGQSLEAGMRIRIKKFRIYIPTGSTTTQVRFKGDNNNKYDSINVSGLAKDTWHNLGPLEYVWTQNTTTPTKLGFELTGELSVDPDIEVDVMEADGIQYSTPHYVINSTPDTFQLSTYRGGNAVTPSAAGQAQYQTIQGKLFRVVDWRLVWEPNGVIGIDLGLTETTADLYSWSNDKEVAPATPPGIAVNNQRRLNPPSNFEVESGTDALLIKAHGTVISRSRLTWDGSPDRSVANGGFVDIFYRESWIQTFTADPATDVITATGHGLVDNDRVQIVIDGGNTLPGGIDDDFYYVDVIDADTFKLIDQPNGSVIDITSAGTGTHQFKDTKRWTGKTVPGASTETYIEDLEENVHYDYIIRFRNAVGRVSSFVSQVYQLFLGKFDGPDEIINISQKPLGSKALEFRWTNADDPDLQNTRLLTSNNWYGINPSRSTDYLITCRSGFNFAPYWYTVNHTLSNGDIVYFSDLLEIDSSDEQFRSDYDGIERGKPYYVINKTANAFQISETLGGSAIDISSIPGSFTHPDPVFTMIPADESKDIVAESTPKGFLLYHTLRIFNETMWYWLQPVNTSGILGEIKSIGPVHALTQPDFSSYIDAGGSRVLDEPESGEKMTAYWTKDKPTQPFPLTEEWDQSTTGDRQDSLFLISTSTNTRCFRRFQNTSFGEEVYFSRSATQPADPVDNTDVNWSPDPPSGTSRLWGCTFILPSGNRSGEVFEIVRPNGTTHTF